MATVINLDVTKLQQLSNELSVLDSSLINNTLPELQGTIGNIRSNVLSDRINAILVDIDNRVNDISSSLRADLNKLESFIDSQISGYNNINTNTVERIYVVIVRMEAIAKVINPHGGSAGTPQTPNTPSTPTTRPGNTNPSTPSGTGNNGGGNTVVTPQPAPEPSKEKLGFWEYHGQNFANDWDYSGCDAGLDYIGATVDGVIGTVGSAVNFVVDGVSEFLGWLFG